VPVVVEFQLSLSFCRCRYDAKFETLNRNSGDVRIVGYFQSWKYFDFVRSCVLREFTFLSEFQRTAYDFFRGIADGHKYNVLHVIHRGSSMGCPVGGTPLLRRELWPPCAPPPNETGCKVAGLHSLFTAWHRIADVKLHHSLNQALCHTEFLALPNTDVATPRATQTAAARNVPGYTANIIYSNHCRRFLSKCLDVLDPCC